MDRGLKSPDYVDMAAELVLGISLAGEEMKNQFFADERDFLKYDLWIELGRHLGDRISLSFIPMLTDDDGTKQGKKINYECRRRKRALYTFLKTCLSQQDRRIARLRGFIRSMVRGTYRPYRDGTFVADSFVPDGRGSYFDAVPKKLLIDSVVLIDPDTGLETKGRSWRNNPEKYVRYGEVASIAERISGRTAIIIVHFPVFNANHRKPGLELRAERLRKETGLAVHWISPTTSTGKVGEVAFFVLTRGLNNRATTRLFLSNYSKWHRMIWK